MRPVAATINVQADFLYGAPGSGLAVEAEGRLMVDPDAVPGVQRAMRSGAPTRASTSNSSNCRAQSPTARARRNCRCDCQNEPQTTLPLRARMVASVADPGGRVVRESFTVPVRLNDVYLGMKPTLRKPPRRRGRARRATT